jgi:hypothetical protein
MPSFRWLFFGLICVGLALGCGSDTKVPEYKAGQEPEKIKDKGKPQKGLVKPPDPNPNVD